MGLQEGADVWNTRPIALQWADTASADTQVGAEADTQADRRRKSPPVELPIMHSMTIVENNLQYFPKHFRIFILCCHARDF